jgi:transposase
MAHCTCGAGGRWCARTDLIFGVEGMHVLDVTVGQDGAGGVLVLDVETDETLAGCPACRVVAVGHGRRVHPVHDVPCFGRPVLVRWRKRIWRCLEPACRQGTFSETHPWAGCRGKLTARAISWGHRRFVA